MSSQETTISSRRGRNRIAGASDKLQMPTDLETPGLSRHCFDASLLFRCMERLQVDQSDLAQDDPLLFRELQGVCILCPRKEECVHDLAHQLDDAGWDRWREYCPNSAMLTMIGAVQNCGHAAQHLKMPLAASLSRLR